jgi:outer membrane protein assembly factor BamA
MAIYFIRASNFLGIGRRVVTSTEANWNTLSFYGNLEKPFFLSCFLLLKPTVRVTSSQNIFSSINKKNMLSRLSTVKRLFSKLANGVPIIGVCGGVGPMAGVILQKKIVMNTIAS